MTARRSTVSNHGGVASSLVHAAAPAPTFDPVAALVERQRSDKGAEPAVLVDMDIEVTIRGALALVETTRIYENREELPIEALLSIPVPVHAAFFGLTAKIGGRHLRATAMLSEAARQEYEDAIDEGNAAVLHEELIRGVHFLSVGNLGAGVRAEVTTRWAMPLRFQADRGHLRIPLTVGDVYGISGLPDSDDLVNGGGAAEAMLRARHDASGITLAGGVFVPVADGSLQAKIPANAPVDILVEGWSSTDLRGRTQDGRGVSLSIEPGPDGSEDLDVVVLVDHSGSMSSCCEGASGTMLSTHEALVNALHRMPAWLRKGDRIALWEFDHSCEPVGNGQPAEPRAFPRLVSKLSPPAGGTEIGKALDSVHSVEVRDVLLITDGMSYSLDVQAQALRGRRILVVLVGENSLEANVGHLAALTGGDLQFSFGVDVARALEESVRGLRSLHIPDGPFEAGESGLPVRLVTARGNASIEARWSESTSDTERDAFSSAIAAYAASLAVARSSEDDAARIAVAEGLVTHLTSLVLVDVEGERQEGMPITQKVKLPTPRTSMHYGPAHGPMSPLSSPERASAPPPMGAVLYCRPPLQELASFDSAPSSIPAAALDLSAICQQIHWDAEAPDLGKGSLMRTAPHVAKAIRKLSTDPFLKSTAEAFGIDSLHLAIALLAHLASAESRQARRVLRRLLDSVELVAFEEFADTFAMDGDPQYFHLP